MSNTPLLPSPPTVLALPAPDTLAARLAERTLGRIGDDPFFLGSALVAYQRVAGVDVEGIAAFLDCPVAALPRLALEPRPHRRSRQLVADLERITSRSGARPGRLAAILQFYHR